MNRKQAEQNSQEIVRLDYWPFKSYATTSKGKLVMPLGVGDRWFLNKLTKGGMAMITSITGFSPSITISVPPDCLSELK